MHAVQVHELKNNPSQALRRARKAPVIVMKGDQPEAIIFHLDNNALLSESGLRPALAAALFEDGHLSLGRAARLAEMPIGEFVPYLGIHGIPAITGTAEEALQDLETLRKWDKSSSRTPRRLSTLRGSKKVSRG
jgi:predicted HTH domain antitoxin